MGVVLIRCTCLREGLEVLVRDPLCPADAVHARFEEASCPVT